MKQFGRPAEIAIEFARALKHSPGKRSDIERKLACDQKQNAKRVRIIRQAVGNSGFDPSVRDLLKMRLWEELSPRDPRERRCIYSGERITRDKLLSDEVEIDHIVPFNLTLDDSLPNKIICMRYANRHKAGQTPFEAFGSNPTIYGYSYRWDEIARRAAKLRLLKQWGFAANARAKIEEHGGFMGRQLAETGWLARAANKYLAAIVDPNHVSVVPGALTSRIRRHWQLNSLLADHNHAGVQDRTDHRLSLTRQMEFHRAKNRSDHRHHAIDALVVALTDRGLFASAARASNDGREATEIPLPWPSLPGSSRPRNWRSRSRAPTR